MRSCIKFVAEQERSLFNYLSPSIKAATWTWWFFKLHDLRILHNPISPVGRRTTSRRKYSLLVLDFACIVSFGCRKRYVAVVRGTFIDIDHSVIDFSLQSGIQKFDFNWLRNSAVTADLYSKRTINPFINMLADLLYCIYINKNSYVHPAPTTTFNIHPYV